MSAQPSRQNDRKPAALGRGIRSGLGALALGVPAALGLAACTSSVSAHHTSKAPTANHKTALGSSQAGLSRNADSLCAEVRTAAQAFGHLNLNSPASATSAAGTLNQDFSKLQQALRNVSAAGQKKGGPIESMVQETKLAVAEAKTSFAQFTKGNAGNAKTDFQTALRELRTAESYGHQANIRSCT